MTVLFCDLIGSTELAARLDPEDWQETVAAYHNAAAEAIGRFGGQVAKFLGDGVMAYFGYPEAHDNDAERAARAGLAILEGVATLNEQSRTGSSLSSSVKLSVRVGIDSGAVVVGAGAGTETEVFGEAPNIAARVQAAAAPDTVVISAATHRLVAGLFVVEDCGAQSLKGIAQPMQLYRVVRPAGLRGRLAAVAASRGLTPFVGREDELRILTARWQRVLDGNGQALLIVGEAGIGKSRLVQTFHEQIAGTSHTWVEAAAAPFYQNTPFYPVVEALWQLMWGQSLNRFGDYLRELQLPQSERNSEQHVVDERLDGLQSGLLSAGLKPAEAIPLIAPLLHLPLSSIYPQSPLPPEQQRRGLLATLVNWFIGAARTQPLAIVIEDLHWADESTLELLQLLLEQGTSAQLLLLCTARPEFRAEWPRRANHAQITLDRLSERNVCEMIAHVTARTALATETMDVVVERTGGIPLFVEELTRAVLESGNFKPTGREIPVTLHDSLMARLDRLGSAKEVLQIGSVIGGEFSYELLQKLHPLNDHELQSEVRKLIDADLVYVRGLAPEATYRFKHALIRDAAYEALLKSRRRELHRLVAHTIDEKFPDIKDTQPEVLARHWAEAGETEQAIAEWSRAGKVAEARNAFHEAQESYQQALALLKLLPESGERDARELELRQSLVQMLHMTRGWAAPEAVEAFERVAVVAAKSRNLKQLGNSLAGRAFTAWIAGELTNAGALADQALDLALREPGPGILALRYMIQIIVRFWRGDFAGAEKHFNAGCKFFDDHVFRKSPVGAPIAVFAYASYSAWMLGRADLARQRLIAMNAAVHESNAHDAALSAILGAILLAFMREYEEVELLAARALALSEKEKFPNEAAMSRWLLGTARAQLGHPSEGVELVQQAMADLVDVGQRICITNRFCCLAAAQELKGSITDALEAAEQAIQVNPEELAYGPEALRLRGELRLKQNKRELAESDFQASIILAQKMQAKAWELRTTMSLARLLDRTGRREEARTMLAEIYNWFTEGFDTADLKEAKTLIDELSL